MTAITKTEGEKEEKKIKKSNGANSKQSSVSNNKQNLATILKKQNKSTIKIWRQI